MTEKPHPNPPPPRVRGYVCLCDEEPKVDFCWEQWEIAPFTGPLNSDGHTVEYISTTEVEAMLAKAVRKAYRDCGICPDCGEEIGELCDCESQEKSDG